MLPGLFLVRNGRIVYRLDYPAARSSLPADGAWRGPGRVARPMVGAAAQRPAPGRRAGVRIPVKLQSFHSGTSVDCNMPLHLGLAGRCRRLALVLVAITVLLIGWLQFAWLSQLRDQELTGRRVALRVAAANFQDRIAREFQGLIDETMSSQTSIDSDLLQGHVQWNPERSLRRNCIKPPGLRSSGRRPTYSNFWAIRCCGPRPKGALSRRGLWLEPPALVECSEHCSAWIMDPCRACRRTSSRSSGAAVCGFRRSTATGNRVPRPGRTRCSHTVSTSFDRIATEP